MASDTPSTMRQRGAQVKQQATQAADQVSETISKNTPAQVSKAVQKIKKNNQWQYRLGFAVITILGFATRFWGINHPDQVVFDEVHFGKVSPKRLQGP